MAKKSNDSLAGQLAGLVVAQGVGAILFGILALFWPGLTMATLILMVGVFLLVWSVVGLIIGLTSVGRDKYWWMEVAFSVLTLGVSVYMLRHLAISLVLFITLVGIVFVVRGLVDLVLGVFNDNNETSGMRWLRIITGALGVTAGVLVFYQPVSSGVAMVWVLGLYAVLYGVMVVALALTAKSELES